MTELLSGPSAQQVAESLLHFLWQGAALGLLLAALLRVVRSPEQRYLIALGGLCAMLASPVVTWLVLGRDDGPTEPPNTLAVMGEADPSEATILNAAMPLDKTARTSLQPWLVGVWLSGVLTLGMRLLFAYLGTLWLRGERVALPAPLARQVSQLGRRLGVATRGCVCLSGRVQEALVVGCLKPLVLIPVSWASELPPSVLEAVIAHELAHIRRWDLWGMLLQRLAETLLFYHPVVWWISRRMSIDRELCCDTLAVMATERRVEYVEALELVARRKIASPGLLATSFFGGGRMNLLERVRNVLAGGSPRTAAPWWPAGIAALIAPLIALAAIGGGTPLASFVIAGDEEREVQRDREKELDDERSIRRIFLDAAGLHDENRDVRREKPDYDRLVGWLLAPEVRDEDEDGDDEEDEEEEEWDEEEGDDDEDDEDEDDADEEEDGDEDEDDARERRRDGDRERDDDRPRDRKRDGDRPREREDASLSDFHPQTEREERLIAIIQTLQAEVRAARAAADGSEHKKNDEGESKRWKLENAIQELEETYERDLPLSARRKEAAQREQAEARERKEKQPTPDDLIKALRGGKKAQREENEQAKKPLFSDHPEVVKLQSAIEKAEAFLKDVQTREGKRNYEEEFKRRIAEDTDQKVKEAYQRKEDEFRRAAERKEAAQRKEVEVRERQAALMRKERAHQDELLRKLREAERKDSERQDGEEKKDPEVKRTVKKNAGTSKDPEIKKVIKKNADAKKAEKKEQKMEERNPDAKKNPKVKQIEKKDPDVNEDTHLHIDGKVLAVSQEKRLLEVSVGADDGLKRGDVLNVYRGDKYLGQITIRTLEPDRAVAEINKQVADDGVRPGDNIATRID